jgi:hypothetical protein
LVGRYSVEYAIAGGRKSLAAGWFARAGSVIRRE